MICRDRRLAVLGVLILVHLVGPARAEVFHFACPRLPFPAATQSRAIDFLCGVNGDQTVSRSWLDNPRCGDQEGTAPAEINEAKALQNSLKNNVCSGGNLTTLTQDDFVAL